MKALAKRTIKATWDDFRKNTSTLQALQLTGITMAVGILVMVVCMAYQSGTQHAISKNAALEGKRIVLDAGHGGSDGGTVGYQTSEREAEINLSIALKLEAKLKDNGVEVIMTRGSEDAVADTKNGDMQERREIIRTSGQDITVSIHQNSFPDHSVSGPQVIYAPGSEDGQLLAECIQARMNELLEPNKPRVAASGDYYIVKSGEAPAVIVECGFLSNAAEEALLLQEEYQKQIVEAVTLGIQDYFELVSNSAG